MGAEFTPVFLLLIVAIGIAASMIVAQRAFAPEEVHEGQADALRVGHGPDRRRPAAF